MKVFGPLYPLPLQLAVDHAERFCTLLDGYEQLPPSSDENFVAWLTGRAGRSFVSSRTPSSTGTMARRLMRQGCASSST